MFRELLARLPDHVRTQAHAAYRIFSVNPAHPSLHFKKVWDDPITFSARVGIGYRALCQLDGNTAVWFWIGSHAEYDRLLDTL
jgi:hypothetical protein